MSLRLSTVAVALFALSGCSVSSGSSGASATCSAAPVAAPALFLANPIAGSSVPSLTTTRIYVGVQPNTYVPAASSLTLSGGDGSQIIGGPLTAITSAPTPSATPGNTQPFTLYESNVSGLEAAQTYRVSVTVSESSNLNAPCGGVFGCRSREFSDELSWSWR